MYITLEMFDKAVEDCDTAIQISPSFSKAYFRKALALRETPHIKGTDREALDVIREGLMVDPASAEL